MLNCKEASRLVSESLDRSLDLRERLSLKVHTAMCKGCSNYGQHLDVLRLAAKRLREGGKG